MAHTAGDNDQMFHLPQNATAQHTVLAVPLYNQLSFVFSVYTSGYVQEQCYLAGLSSYAP